MSYEVFLIALTPIIVYLVTELIKIILPRLTGRQIVGLVIPLVSLLYTVITNLTVGGELWQFVLGLISVFIYEFIKQMRQSVPDEL